MKKLLVVIIFFTLISSFLIVMAQDNQSELQKKIQDYQNKLEQIRQQKNTLASQIEYMDTQIYLTQLKMQETEEKIIKTEKEIETLGQRIEGLDQSLSYLSQLMIEKIIETYKNHRLSFFDYLFSDLQATHLLSRIKYLKTVRDTNQKLLIQVQQAKLNFEEQKSLREQKVKELDNLKLILDKQKEDLINQQQAKKNLLAITKNDEIIYQNLLEQARRELAGYSAFVSAAGNTFATFGNGSNGWYYTQRDPQWGKMLLPDSSYSLLEAGCAVTSVAMVCKHYGQNITPATIASDPSKFIQGSLYNWAFSCEGRSNSEINNSKEYIKELVKNNKPVILRLKAASISGLHFIVAFAWDEEKNDFIIHDPYYGPDKYFSERYSWEQVTYGFLIN